MMLKFLLEKYYSEPHRIYHTWCNHILPMLSFADNNDIQITNAQRLAIMFHDVVYIPGASDGMNEKMSVNLMRVFFSAISGDSGDLWKRPSDWELDRAESMILDTQSHLPTSNESVLVQDLDMMILGQYSDHLDYVKNYLRKVRREYSFLNDEQWSRGRMNLLQDLLERERIYHLPLFIEKFENNARINLEKELEVEKKWATRTRKHQEDPYL